MSGARALAGWLLQPGSAERLALNRVATIGYGVYYLGRRRRLLRRLSRQDPATFTPAGPVRALREPLPPRVADTLHDATLAVGAAALLGWRYPVTGPAWAALNLWTLSYRNSWTMLYHDQNLSALHSLVLGVAPSADAVSVDALRRTGPVPPTPAGHDWPIRLLQAVTTATYLLSGIAKISGPLGLRWADGDALRRQVAVNGLRYQAISGATGDLPARLFGSDLLWRALAVGSLATELGAPVALTSPRLGRLWAVATWGMHWGILGVMRIRFRHHLSGAAFVSFFEVERVLATRR